MLYHGSAQCKTELLKYVISVIVITIVVFLLFDPFTLFWGVDAKLPGPGRKINQKYLEIGGWVALAIGSLIIGGLFGYDLIYGKVTIIKQGI